ncbi:MAG: hypothetical protein ACKN9E_10725, partial [Microcystaceae cyanobacterium]
MSCFPQTLRQQTGQLLQGYAITDCLFWENHHEQIQVMPMMGKPIFTPAIAPLAQTILNHHGLGFSLDTQQILGASSLEDYDWGDESRLAGSAHTFLFFPCFYQQQNLGGIGIAKPANLTHWPLHYLTGFKAIADQYAFQVYHWQRMLQTQTHLTEQLQSLTLKLEGMIKLEQE